MSVVAKCRGKIAENVTPLSSKRRLRMSERDDVANLAVQRNPQADDGPIILPWPATIFNVITYDRAWRGLNKETFDKLEPFEGLDHSGSYRYSTKLALNHSGKSSNIFRKYCALSGVSKNKRWVYCCHDLRSGENWIFDIQSNTSFGSDP